MKMKDVSKNVFLSENNVENQSGSACSSDDVESLKCWDCSVNFTSKFYLHKHLFHHIKQPVINLERASLPPLKITLKNTKGEFEIVNSQSKTSAAVDKLEEAAAAGSTDVNRGQEEARSDFGGELNEFDAATLEDINGIIENETSGGGDADDMVTGPIITEITDDDKSSSTPDGYDTIPGAEPTPPPDPTPDSYPKIRIKTTGLLKDPMESRCTITEVTDENSNAGDSMRDSSSGSRLWSAPSLEDPLKMPDSEDNILSLFNNNERAKDFGFTTSESEYISLDRLDSRSNSGAMQLYNPQTSVPNQLENLTGLPMQALAQQVSRLQPSGNGMHQQNVLINIQQFPQAPPQSPYQPPPMYHHSPMSGQPMYQPYQYQPPNPMYYPPGPPGYPPPPQHMPQPPPMGQMMGGQPPMNPQPMGQPPMSQAQIMSQKQGQQQQTQQQQTQQQQRTQQQQQPGQFLRQTLPGGRVPGPRSTMAGQRMGAPRQPMNPRGAPMATRQRAPMTRPRSGPMMGGGMRGPRPRMAANNANAPGQPPQLRPSPVKRTPDQVVKQEQNVQAKKRRFDVLTPDKDDEDCQVICMQPKNTDGLPQIESVQGGTSEPPESSIMHLSDSITLSVRNPPPKPASPKKSDAKAVANILATRGITVTPTAKPKEKENANSKASNSLNLNGAVSIIPSAKQQQQQQTNKKSNESDQLTTVDLTDDVASNAASSANVKQSNSPQKPTTSLGLPYRCCLCPAQYPNALGLSKHQQSYHKTSGTTLDLGIPLVNLKQPGIMQKLSQFGIQNFIPLPAAQPDGTFAIPIINARNPGNINSIGVSNMLVLGPVKTIPRPPGPNVRPQGTPPK